MKNKKECKNRYVFSAIKTHKENILWILYLVLASVSGIIGFLDRGLNVLESREVYFLSLSILAPLFVDFLIQNLEFKLGNASNRFLKRKTITLGLCMFVMILIIIGLCTKFNSLIFHIIFQIIIYITSVILSLYMFCLQKLILYGTEYSELDDKTYAEEINEASKNLSKKQKNIKKIENDEGKEIKL